MVEATQELTLEAFDEAIIEDHLEGQWKADAYLEKAIGGPAPSGVPYVWRWETVHARLLEACRAIPETFTARRHLGFMNPKLHRPGRGITHTLAVGMQMVRAGEVCWAHRHSISALRFVVEGHPDAFTVVDGERCPMEQNDLVLTPKWSWHDHHNPSDRDIVWLDGLDAPLIAALNVGFYEPYGKAQQLQRESSADGVGVRSHWLRPAWERARVGRLPLRYRWSEVEAQLRRFADAAGSAYDGVALEYTNPVTGGPTLPTIDCWIQRLAPDFEGRSHRHTSSTVCFVVAGHGSVTVGDQLIEWGPRDCFVVPNWSWHSFTNGSSHEPALLFSMHDTPLLATLGLYYEEPETTWRSGATPAVPTVPLQTVYRPDAFVTAD